MSETSRDLYIHPPVWALLIAVIIGGSFFVAGKHLESKTHRTSPTQPGTISVTGEGKSETAPDIALLQFGVQTKRAATATAAINELKLTMSKVIATVKEQGVEEKDISTASFSLSPVYDYTTEGQIPRGFQASQSLSVKVRKIDDAGKVLTAATDAGANDAGGVQFTLDDPTKQRDAARQKAIDQAKAKAQALARQLGVSLGRIIQFSEGGGYASPMMYGGEMMVRAKAMDAGVDIELPSGQEETNVSVTLTYELR